MSRTTQKRRCWTACAVCALLVSGVRVPALLGPAWSRSPDPVAGAATPALHASFAVATEVTARSDDDDRRAVSDDGADGGDPRAFTADPIYAAIHDDPLAVRARGGVLNSGSKIRPIGNANPHAAAGGRGFAGAPRGAVNPEVHASARWGGGTVGTVAADTTNTDSSDPRRTPAGGRHPGDHEGPGQLPPDGPPPVITINDPGEFPSPVGIPSDSTGPIGVVSTPPPPALHAVPLPAPLALGLSGLALAAASARKRLGLRR